MASCMASARSKPDIADSDRWRRKTWNAQSGWLLSPANALHYGVHTSRANSSVQKRGKRYINKYSHELVTVSISSLYLPDNLSAVQCIRRAHNVVR